MTRNSTWFVDEVCHSDGAAKLTMSRVWATPAGDTKKRSSSILLLLVLCACLSYSSAQHTSDAVQWQVVCARICRKCLRFVAMHCLHLCACIYLCLPPGLPPFNFRTAFLSLCTWAETQRSAGGPAELESDGGGESDAELQVCNLHIFIFHALILSTCMLV